MGGQEKQFLLILDLGPRWAEWPAKRSGRALPRGKGPHGTHCTEGGGAKEQVCMLTVYRGRPLLFVKL
jgi:hypothetical protein